MQEKYRIFSDGVKGANHMVLVDHKEIKCGGVNRVHYNDSSVSTKSRHSVV
jgi:hypothetical protein